MKTQKNGYALLITCLLLPIAMLSLGFATFSFLKIRHTTEIKTTCRDEYHNYFTQVKSQILFIESFAPLAMDLYQTQLALLPLIWVPAIAKLYQTLERLRQRFDKLQTNIIASFNKINAVRAYAVVANIQRKLQSENRKVKTVLTHHSETRFSLNSKIQIVKKLNILFPPYSRSPDIGAKQAIKFTIENQISPKSWIQFFNISKLTEISNYTATLRSTNQNKLVIDYQI